MMRWSSRRSSRTAVRSWNRSSASGPNGLRPMYLHKTTSCGRLRLSSVSSSRNARANRVTSSVAMSPRRALAMNSLRSRADAAHVVGVLAPLASPEAEPSPGDATGAVLSPISASASPRKPASAMRARSVAFCFSSFFVESWKVDGSMLGNRYSATGSRNSRKGTMMKTAKGTTRNRSAVVRVSCLRSRRVSMRPDSRRRTMPAAVCTSSHSSLVPIQYEWSVSLKCVH
mmetsp:Transcript_25517/g.101696  ORF Transcript_25517/g.101696 Transcript_25517/m.101696 type:complete len:229 (+) Transcript_25517:523-1209(+)